MLLHSRRTVDLHGQCMGSITPLRRRGGDVGNDSIRKIQMLVSVDITIAGAGTPRYQGCGIATLESE